MTTRITVWGTDGRIFADRQEIQVFLRDARRGPGGLRARLERPLHDRAHRAGRLLPARRGVQRADRALRRARAGGPRRRRQRFRERGRDRPRDRDDDRRRGRTVGRPRPAPSAAPERPRGGGAGCGSRGRCRSPRCSSSCGRDPDGPPAVRRQPVLRRQPHVGGEGARPGDALPVARRRDATCSTAAYDAGMRTFMCTTHDRVGEICDHVRANPERYADFAFYPCMPYAHKYANAVTEDGMLGAIKRFLPDEGLLERGHPRRLVDGQEGHRGHHDAADRRRDEDVRRASARRSSSCRTSSSTCCSGSASTTPSGSSPTTCATATAPSPGFITMNLPALLPVLEEVGIENPIVCSNINKIGFRMCGGIEAYEQALRERRVPRDRDVGLRLRRDPAARRRSSGSASSRTSSRSCSAPRAQRNIRAHARPRPPLEYWAPRSH